MCYAEFQDILEALAEMDADVIPIETSLTDGAVIDVRAIPLSE